MFNKSGGKFKLVCLCGYLLFIAACGRDNTVNLNWQGTNVICFGDSITFGVGAASGFDYPSYLAALLDKEVINAGLSGDTTESALLRLEKDVLEKDPAIVIVVLGGNDFLRRRPILETAANLEKIIKRIQKSGALVFLCDISGPQLMSRYKKEYKDLAERNGAVYIPDLLSGIVNNPSLMSDYIHPNGRGYEIIAQRVHAAVSPYLHHDK
ncbi:MAG: GDSL-type esterase/lipase family protein [Candidatus Omnitrophota bacterium]